MTISHANSGSIASQIVQNTTKNHADDKTVDTKNHASVSTHQVDKQASRTQNVNESEKSSGHSSQKGNNNFSVRV